MGRADPRFLVGFFSLKPYTLKIANKGLLGQSGTPYHGSAVRPFLVDANAYHQLTSAACRVYFSRMHHFADFSLNGETALKVYELPMQENGRVVLPSELRKSLGLAKGDKVMIEAEGDQITLTTARLRRKRAQVIAKRYAQPGVSVVEEFLAEKRVEAECEIERIASNEEATGS